MSSASQASSSQRAASPSSANGAKARIAVARVRVRVSGASSAATRRGRRRRRRRRQMGRRTSAARGRSPRPRVRWRAPGSGRRRAAAPRRSRTGRIRIAWSGDPDSPRLAGRICGFSRRCRRRGRRCFLSGSAYLDGVDRHVRVFDLAETVDQSLPLVRFQQRPRTWLRGRLRAGGSRRGRGRSGRPSRNWSRRAGPRARSPGGGASCPAAAGPRGSDRRSPYPGPWLPVTGVPLITGDVDRVAGACARRRCPTWSAGRGRTAGR